MKKAFDCVEMKNAIQRQLVEEEETVARDELDQRRRHRIETDPVLGPWLQEQLQGQRRPVRRLMRVSGAGLLE